MGGGGKRRGQVLALLKIGVALTLIAALLWFVPLRDRLVLPDTVPEQDVTYQGRQVESSEDLVRFEAGDGALFTVHFAGGGRIDHVLGPRGLLWQAPDEIGPEVRLATYETGLLTVIRTASIPLLLLALALLFLGSVVAAYRWNLLLVGAELGIGFRRAFSLTFIGAFFNNIMPGLTGGDLVKAVYIARDHRQRKTEAIISVLLDRVLGITGLALVAGLVIPLNLDRYGEVAPWIYGLLCAELVFGVVFFSRRLRARLGVDALLRRLPFQEVVGKIDRAVFLYRYRRPVVVISLLLSMLVHTIIIVGIGVIGQAIDMDVEFASYFAVVPIGLIVSALPVAPSGWGVGEAAFVYFWGTLGVPAPLALALAFVYRIEQMVISLIGGACLAVQKERMPPAEEMQAMSDDADPAGPDPAAPRGPDSTDPDPRRARSGV